MNVPGRAIAFRHPDLRQSSTSFDSMLADADRQGDNQYGDRDITYIAGQVGLARLDAAGATGDARAAW